MTNKNVIDTSSAFDEFKGSNIKHSFSKFEFDLYHEEDDISEKVIRVKKVSMPNKGEKWKVFENNKILHVIDGSKLTKKERDFLKSVDGAIWFLEKAKIGIKSFNSFKSDLKEKLAA
jgi:hypothetical protein